MTFQLIPSRRMALYGLVALAILSFAVFNSGEVPWDPFKDGQAQQVHDQGMCPERNCRIPRPWTAWILRPVQARMASLERFCPPLCAASSGAGIIPIT